MVSPKILGVQAKNPIWPPDYNVCIDTYVTKDPIDSE